MNPYLLQDLDDRLGNPRWFWPLIFVLLLVLFGLAGSCDLELLP